MAALIIERCNEGINTTSEPRGGGVSASELLRNVGVGVTACFGSLWLRAVNASRRIGIKADMSSLDFVGLFGRVNDKRRTIYSPKDVDLLCISLNEKHFYGI